MVNLKEIRENKYGYSVLVMFFVLLLLNVFQYMKIQNLKGQRDMYLGKLSTLELAIKNQATVKEPSVSVKTTERTVHLTEKEKDEIAHRYNIQINELNDIISGLMLKVTEVTSTGRETTRPEVPVIDESLPQGGGKGSKVTLVGFGYPGDGYGVGLAFQPFKRHDISIGALCNDSGKVGLLATMRF